MGDDNLGRGVGLPTFAFDTTEPTPVQGDKRVRTIVNDYRVVVPEGRQKGSRFFLNNSSVVIERRSKDATGAEKWDRVASFAKPGVKDGETEIDLALYWLLAGPDAE